MADFLGWFVMLVFGLELVTLDCLLDWMEDN